MFVVFSKDKIFAYLVSLSTVVILFVMSFVITNKNDELIKASANAYSANNSCVSDNSYVSYGSSYMANNSYVANESLIISNSRVLKNSYISNSSCN